MWQRREKLKRENESHLIAAQNNATRTNYIEAKIDNTLQNRKFTLYGDRHETANHIINEYNLAQKEYILGITG